MARNNDDRFDDDFHGFCPYQGSMIEVNAGHVFDIDESDDDGYEFYGFEQIGHQVFMAHEALTAIVKQKSDEIDEFACAQDEGRKMCQLMLRNG